jgi:ribosomal protein S18 acetylase RimI-like enzyme
MTPKRVVAPYDWAALLRLIRSEFAYMEDRIDPPSSMHRLIEAEIARQADTGEVWVIEDAARPVACVFLTPKPEVLYLGKLAVDGRYRGRGLARELVDLAVVRAQRHGLREVELQTRVELVENHATFARLGFVKTGETAHEGYDRPTSITMRRKVP